MSTTRYEEVRKLIEDLGPADQLRLVTELTSRLSGEQKVEPRGLLDLEGLGQDVWEGLDIDEYLRRERTSWHG